MAAAKTPKTKPHMMYAFFPMTDFYRSAVEIFFIL